MNAARNCPFCEEATGVVDAQFAEIYPEIRSRRLAASGEVFAIPTLGQIFPSSLLLVSTSHIDRFAEAPELHGSVRNLISQFSQRVGGAENLLAYEHGALCSGSGGCGVYHAHLHLVPLPDNPGVEALVGIPGRQMSSLEAAWQSAAGGPDYLVVSTLNSGVTLFQSDLGFGSQFMRKRLVEYYKLKVKWDWRQYTDQEDRVVQAINNLRAA